MELTAQIAGLVVVVGGALAVVYKGLKAVYKASVAIHDLNTSVSDMETVLRPKIDGALSSLERIEGEMKPNSGLSLRDAVDFNHGRLVSIERHLGIEPNVEGHPI